MKSKLLTRILLITLALLTVLSLAACNDKNDQPPAGEDGTTASQPDGTQPENPDTGEDTTDDGETTTVEDGPDIPAGLTFGGDEFKIYIRGIGGDGVDYGADLFVGYTLGATPTAVERAVYNRMSDIADTYDVVFSVEVADGGLDRNHVDNSAKTDVDVYDLIVDHGRFMFGYAEKNSLLDYANLPYVDTDQPWWNQEANETFRTPGGKLFVMTGDISYLSVGTAFTMFFNKELVGAVEGLSSPYEEVYADNWTFEVFENYVTTVDGSMNGTNTGVVGEDSFGYATAWWRGPVQMFYSTGGRVLERRNDAWKFTLNNETANEALFDFRDLVFKSGSAHLESADNYQNLQLSFMADQIAFFDDQLLGASVFKGSDVDFGLLPWPKYNDDVEEYYSAVDAGTNLYGVLRNTSEENAKKVSAVLESFAYLGSKDVIPFYFDTILSYQYLKDDDSINMLNIIHENLVLDFGYFYSGMQSTFRNLAIVADGDSLNQGYNTDLPAAKEGLKKWDALDEEE